MAFVRTLTPRYFAPASFETLDAEGNLINHLFDCEFKRLKLSELRQLQIKVAEWGSEIVKRLEARAQQIAAAEAKGEQLPDRKPEDDASLQQDMVNRRLLQEVMTNWRAVQDENGQDMAFSMETLDKTEEEFPGFINACAKAFWKSTQPAEAAHLARKNS